MAVGIRAMVAVAVAGAVVLSCSSNHDGATKSSTTPAPPTAEGAPSLDGLYELAFAAEGAMANGKPWQDPNAPFTTTWAFRTVCPETGCVATASKLVPYDLNATPVEQWDFDFVDGHWLGVMEIPAQSCTDPATGETKSATFWLALLLEPRPDGSLSGTAHNIGTDACLGVRQWPVTATRKQNIPDGVKIADPGAQPPRVTSPAKGFHSHYALTPGAAPKPTATWSTNTVCLRTGERCATLVDATPEPGMGGESDTYALVFADGRWAQAIPLGPQPCAEGSADSSASAIRSVNIALPPPPVPDPITSLSVETRFEKTGGACPGTTVETGTLQRISD
jgi:serine/threonine-protein kinase